MTGRGEFWSSKILVFSDLKAGILVKNLKKHEDEEEEKPERDRERSGSKDEVKKVATV